MYNVQSGELFVIGIDTQFALLSTVPHAVTTVEAV